MAQADWPQRRDEEECALGHSVTRPIVELNEHGALVDGGPHGPLFIPQSQIPDDAAVGTLIRIFIYGDDGRVVATARRPHLELGMVGSLRVCADHRGTAYLDNGIPKDLMVPLSEQREPMSVGRYEIVYVAIDDDGRLYGTQHLKRYLRDEAPRGAYRPGDEVVAVALSRTPLGYRMAIDDRYFGLLHARENLPQIKIGRRIRAFIGRLRDDGRLNVELSAPGRSGVEQDEERVLKALHRAGGTMACSDDSSPEEILALFGLSKRRFKQVIGALYRRQLLVIETGQLVLTAAGAAACAPEGARINGQEED